VIAARWALTYSLAVVSEKVREVISLASCSSRVALLRFRALIASQVDFGSSSTMNGMRAWWMVCVRKSMS
jgi:hypothetical protein